jgi:hypothetical protein
MKWLVGSVVCAFLLLTPMVGMFSMPWAPILVWSGTTGPRHGRYDGRATQHPAAARPANVRTRLNLP